MILLTACGAPQASPTPTPAAPIDLVALGDSTPAGVGVVKSYVDLYAEYLQTDLGIPVRVHNLARPGQHASQLLTILQDDQSVREKLQQAEVITIWTGMPDALVGVGVQPKGGACGAWEDLDLECVRTRTTKLKATFDAIAAEILTLRSSDETLILFADVGNPLAGEWQALGVLDRLKGPVMEEWINHVTTMAAGNNFHVVHSYRVLNGPNGDEAVAAELGQADGLHFNSKGHRLLADLHRQVGYGPLAP